MTVVALSFEPYAVTSAFPVQLARALDLELIDLASFERRIAERLAPGNANAMLAFASATVAEAWSMSVTDLASRLRELPLEAALTGNALVTGWTAVSMLHALPHVATVHIQASRLHRAMVLQRHQRYPLLGTALLDLDSEDMRIGGLLTRVFGQSHTQQPERTDFCIAADHMEEREIVESIRALAARKLWADSPAAADAIRDRLLELR